ncbi:Alpha/Beta hydrolase protein [Mycena epipterygia]|nr:Alpha/Beta hydrolase protein [Mycena epipterygia]
MLYSQVLLAIAPFFFSKAVRPIVSLDYGTFQGANDGNLTKFLGVPFARPAARFEPPQPPTPLDGLQDATAFGPACPQQALSPFPFQLIPNHTFMSEACLTLDVFKPASAHPGSKLPILVEADAVLPGGFEVGSSGDTDFRGAVERSMLLGEPIIIVAPNYSFGFLAGKEVSDAGITNLGLRDQIFALEWVQKHIAAFGGDPERVVLLSRSKRWLQCRFDLYLAPASLQQTHLVVSISGSLHGVRLSLAITYSGRRTVHLRRARPRQQLHQGA